MSVLLVSLAIVVLLQRPVSLRFVPTQQLVRLFKRTPVFWQQFDVGKALVARGDRSVLPELAPWLSQDDRHIRGNVAFIFAGFGDPRGFEVLRAILDDRTDRPEAQGIVSFGGISSASDEPDEGYKQEIRLIRVKQQIASDRYYAAHLFGDLKDPRAVPMLTALLSDQEVNAVVPWSLSQIGDKRAVGPLIAALADPDPSIRVLVIYALRTLRAREAIPALHRLLSDHERSHVDKLESVSDAARDAIAELDAWPRTTTESR